MPSLHVPATAPLTDAVWIDLFQPTQAEIDEVQRATGLTPPSQNQIDEIESSSRLVVDHGSFRLSAPLVSPHDDEGPQSLVGVGFVLNDRVLVTIRFAAHPVFDEAHKQARSGHPSTSEEAFLKLLEMMVDSSADALERAGAACDELSRGAFHENKSSVNHEGKLKLTLRRLGRTATRSSHLRDQLLGLGRISSYVAECGVDGAPKINVARLKSIRTDIGSLTDYESHLSAKIQFLLDATLGFISIEQNEVVKTLTVVSVVGIPPVVVAGIYGMNFHHMPELEWQFGYPMAMLLMVVASLLPLLWFKKRGWM